MLEEGRWFLTRPEEVGPIDAKIRAIRDAAAPGARGAVLVARAADGIVGFLTLAPPPPRRMRHIVYLEVVVAAPARGQGTGRALVDAGIAWATAHPEVTRIALSVFADNPRAVALYERAGFVVEGRRAKVARMEDGSFRDDVLMARPV